MARTSDTDGPALAASDDIPPPLLDLGPLPEAFPLYEAEFRRLYRDAPVFCVLGHRIIFEEDRCLHVCRHEERFDRRRKRAEGLGSVRDDWDQIRAAHIPWIAKALTDPTLVVHNNQAEGCLAYLLGYPRGDYQRPHRRYYVSIRPTSPSRAFFKTAFPIDQEQWDRALRGRPGRKQILYRRPSRRR